MFAITTERWNFAEYLTKLIVAVRKNVSAINAEIAQSTDQPCLNRWITQVPWDIERLSQTLDGPRRPFTGTASNIWAWGTVGYAPLRGRPGTCIW